VFQVGLGREGPTAYDKATTERGSIRKELKRKRVKQQGRRTFIDVKSGG
jgi:hypothetical protein